MEEKRYKITLSNGVILDNLMLNGDNFISELAINTDTFADGLNSVVINDGVSDVVHGAMILVQITTPVGGEWWFVLRDLTEMELRDIKTRSDIEYLAMMGDVVL